MITFLQGKLFAEHPNNTKEQVYIEVEPNCEAATVYLGWANNSEVLIVYHTTLEHAKLLFLMYLNPQNYMAAKHSIDVRQVVFQKVTTGIKSASLLASYKSLLCL